MQTRRENAHGRQGTGSVTFTAVTPPCPAGQRNGASCGIQPRSPAGSPSSRTSRRQTRLFQGLVGRGEGVGGCTPLPNLLDAKWGRDKSDRGPLCPKGPPVQRCSKTCLGMTLMTDRSRLHAAQTRAVVPGAGPLLVRWFRPAHIVLPSCFTPLLVLHFILFLCVSNPFWKKLWAV